MKTAMQQMPKAAEAEDIYEGVDVDELEHQVKQSEIECIQLEKAQQQLLKAKGSRTKNQNVKLKEIEESMKSIKTKQ